MEVKVTKKMQTRDICSYHFCPSLLAEHRAAAVVVFVFVPVLVEGLFNAAALNEPFPLRVKQQICNHNQVQHFFDFELVAHESCEEVKTGQ